MASDGSVRSYRWWDLGKIRVREEGNMFFITNTMSNKEICVGIEELSKLADLYHQEMDTDET